MNSSEMNVLCVLFVLCISAIAVQGRSKSPLLDEDGARIINKAAECVFGSQVRELGSSWVPDLGIPIGVLYCMKCECVPSQRKRRIVARVQCRSIKNECPEPSCEEPVLLPGNCCKSCPGDNYSEEVHDVVPQNTMEEEERNTKHYAALLTGRSPLVLRNDDMKPIINDNKNNVVATGRFTFQKKNLYFSFYISDKAARPRSLQFVDENANILDEIVLSGAGGIVNSHYQNVTRKVCGVWKRLPRDYRKYLKEGKLYAVLVWGVKHQSEFMLSGKITKYVALSTELFSSLLEPAPGTDPVMMAGAGGTAIVSIWTATPSIHIAIVFNGVFTAEEKSNVTININLSLDEKKVIYNETLKIEKPAHELNVVEIKSSLTTNELKHLTKGKLVLSISSISHPTALKLSGNLMTKATCELFQTTLSSPGNNNYGTSGLAWLFLNNDGSLVYNIQVDGLTNQQQPMYITLQDMSTRKKTELEDLTPYYRMGWANGTVDRIFPKLLDPLYSGNLAVNVATQSENSLIRGKLSPRLVAEARDASAPVLLKREDYSLPTSAVGMAWINVDNDCNIHYDVSLTGLGSQERQLELYLEFLPMIAPGAPVLYRHLGEIQGSQVEGSPTEALRYEELNRLDSGVCFIKVKESHNRNATLLAATLKQVKVPLTCLPHYTDNDVHILYDTEVPQGGACLHEGRFFKEEASWTSTQDPCTMCYCQNGNTKCDTSTCPELHCSNNMKIKNPGECCPICANSSAPRDIIPAGCTFGGKFYSSGSKFHPFLIPNGFDHCTECACEEAEVKCTRKGNEKQCCRNCETEAMRASENGTYLGDGSRTLLPDIVKPVKPKKNVQQILLDGGCKNPADALSPFENGQKYHPFIATLGEFKCVTCKCKNGNTKCERPNCTKALCQKFIKSHRNHSLIMGTPESCCSLQYCRRYRRHHKPYNNKS
ncbi:PREDICTED: dorsal-ventral patterning protein Sog [Nicrophorus vespilloides]|uniref:Dorsal-ventral patterning protein Sog n=1 Tax=Nicrophorus vespilloides TaxID=110193 RepID=A0ABM1MAR5_NICVS|nr:PREDICTED: dorsal-ventral patterning protein Sog [Nicrophorus vespilloides]